MKAKPGRPLRASKHDAKVALCDRMFLRYCNSNNKNDDDDDDSDDDDNNDDDDDDDEDDDIADNNVNNNNEDRIVGDDFVDEDGHLDDNIAPTSDINLLATMDFINDNAALDDTRTVLTMLRSRSRARRDMRALPSICPHCDDKNLILRPLHEQKQHVARCEQLNKKQ